MARKPVVTDADTGFRIATAQLNFIVGDIDYNLEKIIDYYYKAVGSHADLVIFSELAITGYPPEDLLLRKDFINKALEALEKLKNIVKQGETAVIIGNVNLQNGKLYNSAYFIYKGEYKLIYNKHNLPNYSVFDEYRYFSQGNIEDIKIIDFKNQKIAVAICEDIWEDIIPTRIANLGAKLLIAINASPFDKNKQNKRTEITYNICKQHGLDLIYVNQFGGQDELIFDGGSFAVNNQGDVINQADFWEENFSLLTYPFPIFDKGKHDFIKYEKYHHIYHALVTALRDYINKNNFKDVLIGYSGGIDSALTSILAVQALGKENVRLIILPSYFTSDESLKDATRCAENLGIKLENLNINYIYDESLEELNSLFSKFGYSQEHSLTEENLQSRIRGLLLMAVSNKTGSILITTGNKSEMATGYATIYGDMCGGYNLLKDLYKTEIYELSNWINDQAGFKLIPQNIIDKAPTAELRDNQKDEDTLPKYEILDEVLYLFIEENLSVADIHRKISQPVELIEKIVKLVKNSEYKRRQAVIGAKLSYLAFGKDRRFPITNGFKF